MKSSHCARRTSTRNISVVPLVMTKRAVSGKYKGQGYGRLLLEEALKDSESTNGFVVVTGLKKMAWLVDRKIRIDSLEAARNVPYANGLVGVNPDGKFLSHEITTAKKFKQILEQQRS